MSSVQTSGNLAIEFISNLLRYREYLRQSVARDLRKAYKRSSLGYVWSMLNPLLMMSIQAVVFTHIMRIKVEHYAVFLFVGILPWQYFSQTVTGGLDSIRANLKIIEHLPIPKYIFALSLAFSKLANLALALVPLFGVMLFLGRPIPATVWLMPFIIIPLMMISIGASLFFAALNVFFDDTRHLVQVGLQAAYYLTPIIYGEEHLPKFLAGWLQLNPMYHIIKMMRSTFYYGQLPDLYTTSVAYGSGLLVLLIGLWTFRKADKKFMYFV